jgi:hypothetical protein
MHSTTLLAAEGDLTSAVGFLPASGVALILAATLVYGVIGRGRQRLASGPAQIVGAVAELAFLRADAPFNSFGQAIQSISTSLAGAEGLGAPGMPTICLLLLVLAALARLVPVIGALLGLVFGGAVESAEGTLWVAVADFLAVPLTLVGAA